MRAISCGFQLFLLSALFPLPTFAQARWTLKETLRVGGAESGPAMFVQARSIDADAQGRILVYDRQTQDIRMFAPDGKYIRTIGRKGSGPGEMRNAEGMVIADCDLARQMKAKRWFDVAGHYGRTDVLAP